MNNVEQRREEFQYWLADMEDEIDRFVDSLPKDLAARLDRSPESLDALEAWILKKYPQFEDALDNREASTLDGVARYVGQTFRTAVGGKWTIELSNSKSVNFGVPSLSGFDPPSLSICPLHLVTAAVQRRKGNYLSTILRNRMKNMDTGPKQVNN